MCPLKSRNVSIFNDIDVGTYSAPAFGDMDQDGYYDLIVGNGGGRLFYFRNESIDDVENKLKKSDLPQTCYLAQNYPNPFNNTTTISYSLPQKAQVEIKIYDVLGRCLKTLVDTEQDAGQQAVQWDGRDEAGNVVSSGVYFYRIKAGEISKIEKMVFLQ